MAGRADEHRVIAEEPPASALDCPDEIVRRELAHIIPVIASVMAQQANASSCSFYIYGRYADQTIATFRHGDIQLIFPELSDADSISPEDIPIEAEILRTGKSITRSTAADFERYPMINDKLRDYPSAYADVVVPLKLRDKIYGAVYLWRYASPGPFTPQEIASAESLAQVSAMAVEFSRQYVEERTRRQRLNALLSVASLAASHYSVEDVMPAVTGIIRSVTEADVCNLYVFDEPGDTVIASFSSGLNEREKWVFEESDKYPVESVPAEERARETLGPVVIRDPATELAGGSELVNYALEAGISEILVVPIVYQQSMIGVVYLWYRDGAHTFSEESKSTVQGISNQAGGVIYQARLHDAHQQHIAETEALRRIGETVLSRDSLNDTLDQIADVLHQMIPYDYALVGQVNYDDETVVVRRIWGDLPEELLNYRIEISSSLMGEVVRTGQILNVPDAYAHPGMHRYRPQTLPIRSVLIAPLVTEQGTTGVLYLGRKDKRGYTRRQEQLMTLLSQRAAIAIERTRARESLAMRAARQTALANITNRLVAVENPLEALQDICEMASGILADGIAIALSSWRYGTIQWIGACHANDEHRADFYQSLMEHRVTVDPDRVENMLGAAESSLMPLENGAPADGRVLHQTVVGLLDRLGARHLLNVPMRQRGRAPGLLVLVTSDQQYVFDDELRGMAQIVANRIGDALERWQMVQNRESLLRLSEAINSHVALDDLLEMFRDELHQILPYDEMYVGMHDPETDTTTPLTYVNPFGLSIDDVTFASNQGISGEVMRTRKAVLDNEAHLRASTAYGSAGESEYYAAFGESAMAVPMIAEDRAIGVLFIGRTGANRFSESDFETFMLFSGLAASAIQRTELLQTNQLMYRASVEVLAAVVDAKDPTTLEHSRKVARYARMIAEEAQLSVAETERIELAALLHDIGKLSIPDHVLSKPGPLNPQERALINTHPDRGANILMQHPALMNLVPLVRHHHERVDGHGYPDGLQGDDIPAGASIICVADAFDTMTSQRTYQRRRTYSEAIEELKRNAGTQFDADTVDLFVRAIRHEPMRA